MSRETLHEVRVRGDRAHDHGVDAALARARRIAMRGWPVSRSGIALVVHVVQQPDDAPELLVGAVAARRRRASTPRPPGSAGAAIRTSPTRVSRDQASSRESPDDMTVTLAERLAAGRPRRPLFPWRSSSSTAACPCAAPCSPPGTRTAPFRSWPRRSSRASRGRRSATCRGSATSTRCCACSQGIGVRGHVAGRPRVVLCAADVDPDAQIDRAPRRARSARRSCSPGRCSRASGARRCRRRAAT